MFLSVFLERPCFLFIQKSLPVPIFTNLAPLQSFLLMRKPNTKCPQNFHRKAKKNRALERYKARDQRRSCKIVKLKSNFFHTLFNYQAKLAFSKFLIEYLRCGLIRELIDVKRLSFPNFFLTEDDIFYHVTLRMSGAAV